MGRGSPTAAPSPAKRQRDSQHGARVEGAARKTLELFFLYIYFFSSPAIFSPPAHSTAPHRRPGTVPRHGPVVPPLPPAPSDAKGNCSPSARPNGVQEDWAGKQQEDRAADRDGDRGTVLRTVDPQDPSVVPPAQAPFPLPASASPTPASAPEKSKPAVRKTTATQAERHNEGKEKKKEGIKFKYL